MSTHVSDIDLQAARAALKERAALVENYLDSLYRDDAVPPRLREAARYSLLAGGKRIRPVLCLSTARLCGLSFEAALPFACAIEMIHSYSLIHDDLPAMDDDDLRRGKPSNHKKFGEATAILAGDTLLTDAFCLASYSAVEAAPLLSAMRMLAQAAGGPGMVGGQVLDMEYSEPKNGPGATRTLTEDDLERMQAMKTGALLRAPCMGGALLADVSAEAVAALSSYGTAIGATFQIVDDILDVIGDEATLGKPVGSDAEQGKLTWPALIGLTASRERAAAQGRAALDALEALPATDIALPGELSVLRGLTRLLLDRVS